MKKDKITPPANDPVSSDGLLECPNCQDGVELVYDGEWYERRCPMCGGSGMLDKKQSDGLQKLRSIYQKTKHSNDTDHAERACER